jgi:hypothetical protein
MAKKHKNDSSFYCGEKGCRKTAWDTPEYLTEADWAFLKKVRDLLATDDRDTFFWLMHDDMTQWKAFFDRMVGWPEGSVYCMDPDYLRLTGWGGIKSNHLVQINTALASHNA